MKEPPSSYSLNLLNKPCSQTTFFDSEIQAINHKQATVKRKNTQANMTKNTHMMKYIFGLLLASLVLVPVASAALLNQGATHTKTKFGFKLVDWVELDYHTESSKLEESIN